LSRRKRVRERRGDETVYLETFALLMKEVAIREYRGGYGGVSFRIAKGVRYSTGRTRGRSVVVGTELQEAHRGILAVTSKRAAFLGGKKTMGFPYPKLMGRKYMGVERSTFVIDAEGNLAKVMRRVKPDTHADDVLAALPE
jgi:hypothetical protein